LSLPIWGLKNRPFLKSNSRLRMPGRAGSTISSARFCVRHSPSFGTPSAGLRNSLKDRKRRSLSAQTVLALRLRRTAPSVPRGYPSDSRNATLPEKVPPAGQSVLCFEKGSRRMKHVERNQQHLQGGYAYWKEAPHETDRFLADCSCSMLFLRPTRAVRSSAASCVYLRRCIFIADPSVSES